MNKEDLEKLAGSGNYIREAGFITGPIVDDCPVCGAKDSIQDMGNVEGPEEELWVCRECAATGRNHYEYNFLGTTIDDLGK